MKSKAFKYGSLFIGLLAAVVIILSQSLAFEEPAKTIKEKIKKESAAKTDGQSTDNNNVSTLTISTTSFPAAAQINFFQDAFCLFEILFSNEDASTDSLPIAVPLSKFYSTLLRVFISPNAP